MSLTGCATLPSEVGICDGTAAMRKAHAAALVEDGGPKSQDTGERLLTGMQAGCEAVK